MKISKMVAVPLVVLTATMNNNNQVKAGACEDLCSEGFHRGIDNCTRNSLPIMVLGCYAGCGVFYTGCMAVCASLR
jgi:hypothetical protein